MSARRPNSALGTDVNQEHQWTQLVAYRSAADLPDCKVWELVMHALRQGGLPEDRCYSLYRFEPTEADVRLIRKVIARCAAAWLPWARLEVAELPGWYTGEADQQTLVENSHGDESA